MAIDEGAVNIPIGYEWNPKGTQEFLTTTKQIKDAIRSLAADNNTTVSTVQALGAQISQLERLSAIDNLSSGLGKTAKLTGDVNTAFAQLNSAIQELSLNEEEATRARNLFADASGIRSFKEQLEEANKSALKLQSTLKTTGTGANALGVTGTRGLVSAASFLRGFGATGPAELFERTGQGLQGLGGIKDFSRDLAAMGVELAKGKGVLSEVSKAAGLFFSGLGTQAAGLAAALAPIAAVLLPVAAAVKLFTDSLAANKNQIDTFVKAQTDYFKQVGTLTSESAKDQVKSLEAQKAALEAQKAQTQLIIDQVRAAAAPGSPTGSPAAQVRAEIDLKPLFDQLGTLQNQIDGSNTSIGMLTNGLKSGAFAANDFAAAQAAATAAFLNSIDNMRSRTIDILRLMDSGSAEQFDQMRRDIEIQVAGINKAIAAIRGKTPTPSGPQFTDEEVKQLKEYEQQLKELGATYDQLTPALRDYLVEQQKIKQAQQQELSVNQAIAKAKADASQLAVSGSVAEYDAAIKAAQANEERLRFERAQLSAIADTNEAAKDRIAQIDAELEVQKAYLNAIPDGLRELVAAREAERKALDETIQALDERAALEIRAAKLLRDGTAEQVSQQIGDTQIELSAKQRELTRLENLLATASGDAAEQISTKINQIKDDIDNLKREQTSLENILPIVAIRDRIQTVLDGIKQAVEAQADYQTDVTKIEEDSLRKRADIQERYSQKLVDIAVEARRDAEDALTSLRQRTADAYRDYQRDQDDLQRKAYFDDLKLQLQAQRDEVKALRDHERNLQRIRDDAKAKETDLIFKRDFAGLFSLRRETSRKLNEEQQKFIEDRREAALRLAERRQDAARERELDRQNRYLALQQKLQDLQLGYQRELEDAQLSRQRALEAAAVDRQRALDDERADRQRALVERLNERNRELGLIAQNTAQRLKLISDEQRGITGSVTQLLGLFGAAAGGLVGIFRALFGGGGSVPRRELGGSVYSGRAYQYNEQRRESLSGFALPGGRGILFPFKPGFIAPNAGDGQPISISVNSPHANPNLVANAVVKKLLPYYNKNRG